MLFWVYLKNGKAIPALYKNDVNKNHIKNIHTLPSERAFCHHSLQGSMTVEAAIVVPMVFFVWAACIALTSVVQVHETVQNELTNTAIRMSVMAGTDPEMVSQMGRLGAWGSVQLLEGLETGGIQRVYGFDLSESNMMEGGNWLNLKVNYRIRLLEGLIPVPEIKMKNQVCIRAWTGHDPEENENIMTSDSVGVYVSEYGQVYHRDRMCTHIRLKIYMASEEEAKQYLPCEKCIDDNTIEGNTYYVTESGDCYHGRLGCSGLKRTVQQIELTAAIAGGCMPCSRCGGVE